MTDKYMIKENYSILGQEVFERLQKIFNNRDFIVGTMLELNSEEKLQKILDFLVKTGTTATDDIIPYSVKLYKGFV